MFHGSNTGLLAALAATAPLALGAPAPQQAIVAASDATVCCDALAQQFPLQTFKAGSNDYSVYQDYWCSAAVGSPTCVFAPNTAADVSAAVKVAVSNSCKFAAKGGGHMAVPGAANADGGVMISFANMNQHSLTKINGVEVAQVQPGVHWGDLYKWLDTQGKVVAGGRFYPVGTGLVLGAGFSFLANEIGFSTDNVYSFEIVNANGDQVTVSQTSNSDLFKAMKGGGNNFGIITRYNLRAFEGGNIVGGMIVAPEADTDKWIDLVYDYSTRQAVQDTKTHALPAVGWTQADNSVINQTPLFYNDHTLKTLPPIMQGWNNLTKIVDTVGQRAYSDLAVEYATGFKNGDFQEQRVYSIKANRAEYAYAWYRFLKWARSVKSVPGFNILHCNMPVTPRMATAGQRFGGNSLGLDSITSTINVMYFGITMQKRDEEVVSSFRAVFDELLGHAKSSNLHHPWLFWNYAGTGQDVISSYGTTSVNFLKQVRTKYDPRGVFKALVPGGFKF